MMQERHPSALDRFDALAAAAKVVLLVAAVVATGSCSCAAWDLNIIRMPTARTIETAAARHQEGVTAPLIHALHRLLGSAGDLGWRAGVPCDSWRAGRGGLQQARLEDGARQLRGLRRPLHAWPAISPGLPRRRRRGHRVRRGPLMVAGNGKEVWVFDIDETSLSNLPYYAKHGLGYVRTCT